MPRAKGRAADRDDDDDRPRSRARPRDDDEDDDRPRSRGRDRDDRRDKSRNSGKKKGKKKGKPSPALILGLAGAALGALVIVGGLVGWYVLKNPPVPTKEIAGETWYEGKDPGGLVTAYFPGDKPKYDKVGFKPPAILAKQAGADPDELAWNMQTWTRTDGGREYMVMLFALPSRGSSPDLTQRLATASRIPPGPGVDVLVEEEVTIAGHKAQRLATRGGGVTKVALTFGLGSRHLLLALVSGGDQFDHTDLKVVAFFDNLTIK